MKKDDMFVVPVIVVACLENVLDNKDDYDETKHIKNTIDSK